MPSCRNILGISAYYHDAAAALICDGRIAAVVQEERFARKKNDPKFPRHAIGDCLRQAGTTSQQLDAVVFYDKPVLKFVRALEMYLAMAPCGWRTFPIASSNWPGSYKTQIFGKVVLVALFFVILTPFGLILRLLGEGSAPAQIAARPANILATSQTGWFT